MSKRQEKRNNKIKKKQKTIKKNKKEQKSATLASGLGVAKIKKEKKSKNEQCPPGKQTVIKMKCIMKTWRLEKLSGKYQTTVIWWSRKKQTRKTTRKIKRQCSCLKKNT